MANAALRANICFSGRESIGTACSLAESRDAFAIQAPAPLGNQTGNIRPDGTEAQMTLGCMNQWQLQLHPGASTQLA